MSIKAVFFRDCPWCGVKHAAMSPMWSRMAVRDANNNQRSWVAMACPRCGGLITVEVQVTSFHHLSDNQPIPDELDGYEVRAVPEMDRKQYQINHLPEDVARFFSDAIVVMEAGVPDAAAVQLRRTLEAAAAHKGASKKTLVQSVEQMMADGLVTRDFRDVLTHVRKLGNIGAHASDEKLTATEVDRALSFTTQFLRNVFEVPGELELLVAESASDEAANATAEV